MRMKCCAVRVMVKCCGEQWYCACFNLGALFAGVAL